MNTIQLTFDQGRRATIEITIAFVNPEAIEPASSQGVECCRSFGARDSRERLGATP